MAVKNHDQWLALVRPEHVELAQALYALIKEAEPRFAESIKWSKPCFSLGGAKRCYLSDQRNYMRLGFYNGASLSNVHGLIEGTGKALRHVKVRQLSPEISAQLLASIRASAALPASASAS